MTNSLRDEHTSTPTGTHDGTGAGDHDDPYRFGRRPNLNAPFPFTTRQYVRLVVLRGRVQERQLAGDGADFPPINAEVLQS